MDSSCCRMRKGKDSGSRMTMNPRLEQHVPCHYAPEAWDSLEETSVIQTRLNQFSLHLPGLVDTSLPYEA